MRKRIDWRTVACALALVAAATPSRAGLSVVADEPDPIGTSVRAVVTNDSATPLRAVVEIEVSLRGGKTAVSEQSVAVPAHDSVAFGVTFESTIDGVIHVGIIEGPDPIPQ